MELKFSGRIAEDLARQRYRELLERSLKQAKLGKTEDQETVAPKRWQSRVWLFVIRRVAHEAQG